MMVWLLACAGSPTLDLPQRPLVERPPLVVCEAKLSECEQRCQDDPTACAPAARGFSERRRPLPQSVLLGLKTRCDTDDADACVESARAQGNNATIRAQCEDGHVRACELEALRDPESAPRWWSRGCEVGDRPACEALGALHFQNREHTASRRVFGLLCAHGDADACVRLAGLYEAGLGAAPDPERAYLALQKGCDAQDTVACLEAAARLANGVGVEADPDAALELQRTACRRNRVPRCP